MSLDANQKFFIARKAIASIYGDIVENQNTGRLHRTLEKWVCSLPLEDQLQQISSDEDVVREELGFDPVTGAKVDVDEFEGF